MYLKIAEWILSEFKPKQPHLQSTPDGTQIFASTFLACSTNVTQLTHYKRDVVDDALFHLLVKVTNLVLLKLVIVTSNEQCSWVVPTYVYGMYSSGKWGLWTW